MASGARPTAAIAGSQLDAAVLATLDEIDAHGWNPTVNGLYINWSIYDPSQVNFLDHSRARHDILTDLRDLVNMTWYESRHPGDTSQAAYIARLTPALKTHLHGYASDKGWVYWQFLRLGQFTGDPFWTQAATYFAGHVYRVIDPATGVMHGPLYSGTGPNARYCPDGYRVDHNLESGLVLVDAGRRYGNALWAQVGNRMVTVVTAQAYDTKYRLYNRIICQSKIWDPSAKTAEQADEIGALLETGAYVGSNTYLSMAREMLDGLVANGSGLHDPANGGFYFQFDLATHSLSRSYKEARQLTLLAALSRANALFNQRYAVLQREMIGVALRMQTVRPLSGYFYQETPTFQIYRNGSWGSEYWITTEAGGIAAEALQTVLSH
jgi:hypothetical protein